MKYEHILSLINQYNRDYIILYYIYMMTKNVMSRNYTNLENMEISYKMDIKQKFICIINDVHSYMYYDINL